MTTRLVQMLAAFVFVTSAATVQAGIIDTRPATDFATFTFGADDAAGGTFVADANRLTSFTLDIGQQSSGGTFRAIVMGTSGGVPDGTILWQSALTAIPATVTELVFLPDISLTTGASYFVGMDNGLFTDASGFLQLGHVDAHVNNPGGNFFNAINGSTSFNSFPDLDLSSRIEMTNVPEPGTLALLGLGLAGLAASRRRKK